MKFKISDLVAVNMETLKAKDDVFDVEYADTGSVTAGIFGPAEYFESLRQAPSRARRVAMAGDTVYSTVRPNQRHFGFITNKLANRIYSTGFAVLHPNPEKVLPYYFYLIMNQEWVTETLQSVGSGSTSAYPSIRPGDILNLEVEVPDLETQRRIVNIFQSLDGKMLVNNQINDNLLELAQQIFVGKYLSKQDSFPMTTLSEIVGVKTDTFNPKKSNDNEVAHFSLPAFDSGSVPTVDLVDSIKSNKNIITQYTVLVSKMNPTTKRVWIPNYVQGMTNVASTEFLTFNASDEYQQAFIWAVVDSEGYQNHLISGATGSTGSRQRIKPGDAYSFEVGYNPDEAQRIGMILNPLIQQVKNNRDEIVTLVQLRNNLLTNLLN